MIEMKVEDLARALFTPYKKILLRYKSETLNLNFWNTGILRRYTPFIAGLSLSIVLIFGYLFLL